MRLESIRPLELGLEGRDLRRKKRGRKKRESKKKKKVFYLHVLSLIICQTLA